MVNINSLIRTEIYESTVLNLFGKLAMANAVSEFFFSNDSPHTVCSDSSFKLHKIYTICTQVPSYSIVLLMSYTLASGMVLLCQCTESGYDNTFQTRVEYYLSMYV